MSLDNTPTIQRATSKPHGRYGQWRRTPSGDYRFHGSRSRLYVSFASTGPVTVADLLDARWDNPVGKYRKALATIFAATGIPDGTKARWSQKAGCSCPCSPGFILDVADGRDYFVILDAA